MVVAAWPGGSWEDTARMAATLVGIYFAILWLAIAVWTYRDIRDRTRDASSQLLSVLLVLVFNLPGLFLYLMLRPRETVAEQYERSLEAEALLQELQDQPMCPGCRRTVRADYLACPWCRASLRDICVQCGRAVAFDWNLCPYCMAERAPATITAARAPAAALSDGDGTGEAVTTARYRRRSAAEGKTS